MNYPAIIETRLTYDHGPGVGMHCYYSTGLYSQVPSAGCHINIDMSSKNPIYLRPGMLNTKPDWCFVEDAPGQPMSKFRMPDGVEPDYRVHKFWSYGKLYILEFRFDWIEGNNA